MLPDISSTNPFLVFLCLLSKYQELVSVQGKFCGHEKGELKESRLNEITNIEQNASIILYFTATFLQAVLAQKYLGLGS